MKYLLFNPLSNNKRGREKVDELINKIGSVEEIDVTQKSNEELRTFCQGLDIENDVLYLVGGDGTLQNFANATYEISLPAVYFYAGGTGNDFCNDLDKETFTDGLVKINAYLQRLPVVHINGKQFRFINGVGYGIDGMCCEIADDQRLVSDKPINYTSIAINQLLFKYKRRDAEVTVDGVTKVFKNVWICPTMNGRFIGGGMMVAPAQDRLNEKRTVSVVIAHGWSRLRMLMVFPRIFKGTHVTSPIVDVLEGKEITVKFTKPCAIQVDGETTRNVTEYTVTTEKV